MIKKYLGLTLLTIIAFTQQNSNAFYLYQYTTGYVTIHDKVTNFTFKATRAEPRGKSITGHTLPGYKIYGTLINSDYNTAVDYNFSSISSGNTDCWYYVSTTNDLVEPKADTNLTLDNVNYSYTVKNK